MVIDLSIVKSIGAKKEINFVFTAKQIEVDDQKVPFEGKNEFSGTIYNCGEEYVVEGRVKFLIEYECDRCLKECSKEIDFKVHEIYKKDYQGEEFYSFSGNTIDLKVLLQEMVYCHIPFKSLCATDCKGLCMTCGANKNHNLCGCDQGCINIKMAKLKELL